MICSGPSMKRLLSLPLLACLAISTQAREIKNVVLIVSDDLKAHVLGCYGDTICKTPNIDRLAESGVVFDRAYCQGLWCAPSRTSFMRSRYVDKKGITLGEHLRKNDIYSARVGKIFHMRVPGDIIDGTDGPDIPECWDEKFNMPGREAHTPGNYACLNLNIFTTDEKDRQSTKMPHRMFVSVRYEGDGSDQPDFKAADKTVELLREHKDGPFFIATGFVRPHYPNVAPQKYFDMYDWEDMPLPEVPEHDLVDMPAIAYAGTRNGNNSIGKYPDNQKRMWAAYYATVTFMDEQVGKILDELDRLGIRDETAVIFTSDHGYHLGEHTLWQKSNLHEDVSRVPLIISAPGMKSGKSRSLVELVDMYPTVCELLKLKQPDSVQGTSLVPILKDTQAEVKEMALSILRGSHGMRTDRWAYMRYTDGSEELYDMKNDPEQFTNLAPSTEHQDQMERQRKLLEKRLKEIE